MAYIKNTSRKEAEKAEPLEATDWGRGSVIPMSAIITV